MFLKIYCYISDTEMGDDDCFEADPNVMVPNGQVISDETGMSKPGYGWVVGMKLDLPVDEDDYLMPSQQPNSASVGPSHQHYMDLISDGTGKCIFKSLQFLLILNHISLKYSCVIENIAFLPSFI